MSKLSDAFAVEREARGLPPRDPDVDARYAFAGTVMAIRRAAGLSQRQLAELSDVPQAEISRIERGLTVPTVTRAERLLRPLGWRIGALPVQDELLEAPQLVGAAR